MRFSDQIKSGGFADPSTLQGAALFAVVFSFFAWFFGHALRVTVQRVLVHDTHAYLDKARSILLDLGSKHPKATQVRGCPLTLLAASGVVLSLDMWCPDAFTAISLKCELLEQAKKRFAIEGIALGLPLTWVVLRDNHDQPLLVQRKLTSNAAQT